MIKIEFQKNLSAYLLKNDWEVGVIGGKDKLEGHCTILEQDNNHDLSSWEDRDKRLTLTFI